MLRRVLLLLWVPAVVMACFVFASERAEAEEALASWYGPGFSGLPTASGETFDPYGLTAAHKTMPLGTELLVSYGGSSVEVTVNDRGPYVGGRELDLSQGAAQTIGLTEVGIDYVDYAWTGQYAAPPAGPTDEYAPTDQQTYYGESSTYGEAPTHDAGAATSQYAVEEETVFGDGYASVAEGFETAAEPEAATPVASPSGATIAGSVLVVRPGETLSDIAVETGVSEEYLASQNMIDDPNFVYAGQVLYY